ncbi:hypothetical protein C900_03196 [Fulvivirga imtechensis AK7]|uniref:YCII-related domain-containing protein n=1 Tax=Fulvivirga imtechensis AK7 TaxID=1237149 RepID=L8JQ30_9BACT|nr:YciI family protein [Fulvivirga imtechensis]ELR71066.1 hypothetical protein C900_03196 [Fulvivirga imtechensis AK7]
MILRKLFSISLLLFSITAAAQEKYMFVFLNSKPDKEVLPKKQVDSLQAGHMANILRLAKEDKLIVAGPFEGGGGIFILNTQSAKEASEWINTDPAIRADRYNIEILPWNVRHGGACKVNEDAEFATYTFIRYNTFITKFNVQQAPELLRQHDAYLKELLQTGNVIVEGFFDNSDGGIMVMQGAVEDEVLTADPAVKDGIIKPDVKKIWVGKGSFCEN